MHADSLDTWAWAEDSHGADELNALDLADETEPQDAGKHMTKENLGVVLTSPFVVQTCGRWKAFDGQCYTWHATRERAEAAAGLAPQGAVKLTTGSPAEPEPSPSQKIEQGDDTPAASYVGAPLITHDPHAVPSWLRPIGDVVLTQLPEGEQPAEIPQIAVFDDPDPEVRCPPSDPAKRQRYYALLGKAKHAASPGQRIALERRAAELEEWRPLSEAGGSARPLTSKRALGPPPVSGALSPPSALQLAWEDV